MISVIKMIQSNRNKAFNNKTRRNDKKEQKYYYREKITTKHNYKFKKKEIQNVELKHLNVTSIILEILMIFQSEMIYKYKNVLKNITQFNETNHKAKNKLVINTYVKYFLSTIYLKIYSKKRFST